MYETYNKDKLDMNITLYAAEFMFFFCLLNEWHIYLHEGWFLSGTAHMLGIHIDTVITET